MAPKVKCHKNSQEMTTVDAKEYHERFPKTREPVILYGYYAFFCSN
jgi:hypothetical protein